MFRDLSINDKETFLSMMEDFYNSPAVAYKVSLQNFEATFEALMNKSPFLRAFIIEIAKIPIGYALLAFSYSNEFGGTVVLIEELYVTESYRGKGVGKQFFEFLEKEYPLAKQFRMDVRKDNKRAIELYNKLGYNETEYMQMLKTITRGV